MNINTSYNNNHNSISQRPAFKGVTGDRLIKELIEAKDTIELGTMMKEVKGIMGPNKTKVVDIVESFVGKIKELQEVLPQKDKKMYELSDKVYNMPAEWKISSQKSDEVYARYSDRTKQMKERSAEVEERLRIAQNEAKKYEPMKEVKSIEDLDIIMPEKVKEIIDETDANKNNSADSMFNFLMNNGDGKDAFAQAGRFKLLSKSYQDGMYMIPEISEYTKGKFAPMGDVVNSAIVMIKMALKGNPQGSYLESYSTKSRVKDKAVTFLKPLCEETGGYDEKGVSANIDKVLNDALEYHRNFPKGKAYILKNQDGCKMIDNNLGYDTAKSNLEFVADNGRSARWTYDEVARIGSRH